MSCSGGISQSLYPLQLEPVWAVCLISYAGDMTEHLHRRLPNFCMEQEQVQKAV